MPKPLPPNLKILLIALLFPTITLASPQLHPKPSEFGIENIDHLKNAEDRKMAPQWIAGCDIGYPLYIVTTPSAEIEYISSIIDSNDTSLERYRLNRVIELQGLSRAEVLDKYGLPDRINNNTYLYAVGEYRFGLQIRFRDDYVNYVRYIPDHTELTMLIEHIDKAYLSNSSEKVVADLLRIEDRDWTYVFVNNAKRYLYWVKWEID